MKNFSLILGLCLAFLTARPSLASTDDPPQNASPRLLQPANYDIQSYKIFLNKAFEGCSVSGHACKLWSQYLEGQSLISHGDTKGACGIFNRLGDDEDFALFPLVLVRTGELCKDDTIAEHTLTRMTDYLKKTSLAPWLQYELTQGAFKIALSLHAPSFVDLGIAASKLSQNRKNKTEILQNTLTEASKTNNARVHDIQDELYKIAPRLKPIPDDWMIAGLDAAANHDYELAVRAFQKTLKQPKLSALFRRQAFDQLKTSLKALQRKPEALEVSKRRWVWEKNLFLKRKTPEQAKLTLSAGLTYTRFLWTEHQSTPALGLLAAIEKVIRSSAPLGELYFLRGRILEEQKKIDQALFWMKKSYETVQDPAMQNQYRWGFAWANFELGRYSQTQATLEEALKTEQDAGKHAMYTFWLGKTLAAQQKNDDAKKIYQQLIEEDPLGFYPLLAYRELGENIPQPTEAQTAQLSRFPKKLSDYPTPTLNSVSDGKSWVLFDWLLAVGEFKVAREFLDDLAPLPDASSFNLNEELFEHYAKANYFSPLFARIPKMLASEKLKLMVDHPGFWFPRLFSNLVDQGSGLSGLWPEYIFSIMRQESSFNPLSISGANAYGLLQLLPTVAKPLAKNLGIDIPHPKDDPNSGLLDPEINILLGSQHLRKYWDDFDGQFILTTASYNASSASVKSWIETRFRGDPLLFIEDIPYDETRTYVKLVLRNFIHYQLLSTSSGSIPFPEWCLEGIHTLKD